MKKIGRRTREEAIEVLLRCADDRVGARGLLTTISDIASGRVNDLADAAWVAVQPHVSYYELPFGAARYLEAATLLRGDDEREPWSPGDAVYLRGVS